MNSSFPNRWSFSYLKFTKYVINIIAEPKYKYGKQEQVTVRNHKRSTALERSVLKYWGTNRFYGYQTSPSTSVMAQNIQLFGPHEGFHGPVEAKFRAKVTLLYGIITGPLRFSHGFSTKCISCNTNSSVWVQLHRQSRWATIQIV